MARRLVRASSERQAGVLGRAVVVMCLTIGMALIARLA